MIEDRKLAGYCKLRMRSAIIRRPTASSATQRQADAGDDLIPGASFLGGIFEMDALHRSTSEIATVVVDAVPVDPRNREEVRRHPSVGHRLFIQLTVAFQILEGVRVVWNW
jgi:hypothetical protein